MILSSGIFFKPFFVMPACMVPWVIFPQAGLPAIAPTSMDAKEILKSELPRIRAANLSSFSLLRKEKGFPIQFSLKVEPPEVYHLDIPFFECHFDVRDTYPTDPQCVGVEVVNPDFPEKLRTLLHEGFAMECRANAGLFTFARAWEPLRFG